MQIKNIDGIVIKVRYSLAVERTRNFLYLVSVFKTYPYPWYIYLISECLSHPSYWQRSIWPSAAYPEGPLMGLKCVWRTLRISNHIFTPGCMLHFNYSLHTAYAAVLSALTQTNPDHQEVATKFPMHFHHLMWLSFLCLLTTVPEQRPHFQITCSYVIILALEYSIQQKWGKGKKKKLLYNIRGNTETTDNHEKYIFLSFCTVNNISMWVALCICRGIYLSHCLYCIYL